MDIKQKIASSIKNSRKSEKLSQKALAAKIGVTAAAISYWENGVNVPNIEDCWKLADSLGITLDELVGRI